MYYKNDYKKFKPDYIRKGRSEFEEKKNPRMERLSELENKIAEASKEESVPYRYKRRRRRRHS